MERDAGELPEKASEELKEIEKRFLNMRFSMGDDRKVNCQLCSLSIGGISTSGSTTLQEILDGCVGTRKSTQKVIFKKGCVLNEDWS